MKSVIVRSKGELKAALKSDATEIKVDNPKLLRQLRAIKRIRKAGPLAIGVVVAAVPLIPVTGGSSLAVGLVGTMGVSGLGAASSIVGLVVAIGGVVVIAILTDWEEVEIAGVFKLRRKRKKTDDD